MSGRRLALGLLLGVIALAVFSCFVLFPAYPFILDSVKHFLSQKSGADTWQLGEVTVTREELEGIAVTYYSFRDGEESVTVDLLSPEGEKPEYAGSYEGASNYLEFRQSEQKLAADELPKEMAEQLRAAQAVAEKALQKNIWPWPLWHLKPFVRRIADGRARLRVSGPCHALIYPKAFFLGDEEILGISASYITEENSHLEVATWRDRFAARLKYGKFALLGDGRELVAHQEVDSDAGTVDERIAQIRELLRNFLFVVETVPALPEAMMPRLKKVAEVIGKRQVTVGKPLTPEEMDAFLEPWRHIAPEPTQEERMQLAGDLTWQHEPMTIAGVEIAIPTKPRDEVMFTRNGLSVRASVRWDYPQFHVEREGTRLGTLELLNHGAYPKLTAPLPADEESLVSEVCAMARDLLGAPADAWPEGSRTESLTRLLSAIVHRQFLVQPNLLGTVLGTRSEAEGSEVEFYLSCYVLRGHSTDLLLSEDGFSLYREEPESLITSEGEKVTVTFAGDSGTTRLSPDELRQLRGFLKALDHVRDQLPERILPGLKRYRQFLERPEALEPAFVESLAPPQWSTKARFERALRLNPGELVGL